MYKPSLLVFALLTMAFSVQADAAPKKRKSMISCEAAYLSAQKSSSLKEIKNAMRACNDAAAVACGKKSDGTGDGRFIAAACMLDFMYQANQAANKGSATSQCESAYKSGMDSPSRGDVMDAIDTCRDETTLVCQKASGENSSGSESGRLLTASCSLSAAHAGYQAATEKPKKAVDADSCGGKPMPRICKESCLVNYACRNGNWERSPVEICRMCGGAEAGGDTGDASHSAH